MKREKQVKTYGNGTTGGENKNTILNKKELNRTEGAANTSSIRMLSPLHCIT